MLSDDMAVQTLRKRLLLQSQRRGMRELDLLLGSFANHVVPQMAIDQLHHLDNFLQENEHLLYKALVNHDAPEDFVLHYGPLIDQIRAYHCQSAVE